MNAASSALVDGHTHVGVDMLFYLRGHYPYAQDWPSLVGAGEAAGISRFVVFPMVSNLSLGMEAMRSGVITETGAPEAVPYAFENHRLMVEVTRLFPELASRALPLWMIDPSRAQQAQVEALGRLADSFPCFGLKIQATIIKSFVRDLLGSGRCLLEYAAARGLPVLIHSSVHPEDPWSPVGDILSVVREWPDVRFSLAHSCRFDEPVLDEIASLPNAWFDCSAHRIHCMLAERDSPSIAIPGRRCRLDYRNPGEVLHALAERYPEKLVWGSDAPFDSYVDESISLRSSYGKEAELLHALGTEASNRIARVNTERFLSIPG